MRPLYEQLKRHHHSSLKYRPGFLSPEELFKEIGYDYKRLKADNPDFENTCAVRMSMALLKNNIDFIGRMTIKEGPFKGKKIEPGAKLMADQLYRENVFGKAEIYTDIREAGRKLRNRKGVVYFHRIAGYGGGHIDLLEPVGDNMMDCNSGCHTNCKEIWFWELN
ncbi:T6SS effector amidase Tae4 family protein [Kosakonia sp. H02]|nr:T6SS effector amidase Tae4 family protein [Kosakonia sp. H02]